MATNQPIPLAATQTDPDGAEFRAIRTWPFPAEPFYVGQVHRMLQNDIPFRARHCGLMAWVYQDPDGNMVGFGTLEVSKEYESFTDGKYHYYIPLLAVNPAFQKRGHGGTIVQHLIAQAVILSEAVKARALEVAHPMPFSSYLFLDVYTANPAISLYEKCGFVTLNPGVPILDPNENNAPYIIMAKNLAIATA